MKGLLLGAGFSYDLGMPLASEFTDIWLTFMKPDRVHKMLEDARSWYPYGLDKPLGHKALKDIEHTFFSFYEEKNMNYEELFRRLESRSYINEDRNAVSAMLGKFRDIINESFWLFQANSYGLYTLNKGLYRWLLEDFSDDVLWIFSLNHDVMVEMMCIDFGIPLSMGGTDPIEFPFSNRDMDKRIPFISLDATCTDISKLNYMQNCKGINLLKLHGSLNEFFYGDGRSHPKSRIYLPHHKYKNSLEYLQAIGELWHENHYWHNNNPVSIGEEIAISDDNGKMQFLRNSILTGSKKYHSTINQHTGEEKMDLFSAGLKQIDDLYILGYGFGDAHINHRIEHAMHTNDTMRVTIVNPAMPQYKGFDAFKYGARYRHQPSSVPIWVGYTSSINSNKKIEEQIEITSQLRKLQMEKIKKIFERE